MHMYHTQRHNVFGGHFEKCPHAFTYHWNTYRQTDFNSPMYKVSKTSRLRKSLEGIKN